MSAPKEATGGSDTFYLEQVCPLSRAPGEPLRASCHMRRCHMRFCCAALARVRRTEPRTMRAPTPERAQQGGSGPSGPVVVLGCG